MLEAELLERDRVTLMAYQEERARALMAACKSAAVVEALGADAAERLHLRRGALDQLVQPSSTLLGPVRPLEPGSLSLSGIVTVSTRVYSGTTSTWPSSCRPRSWRGVRQAPAICGAQKPSPVV